MLLMSFHFFSETLYNFLFFFTFRYVTVNKLKRFCDMNNESLLVFLRLAGQNICIYLFGENKEWNSSDSLKIFGKKIFGKCFKEEKVLKKISISVLSPKKVLTPFKSE